MKDASHSANAFDKYNQAHSVYKTAKLAIFKIYQRIPLSQIDTITTQAMYV
jgi:hypothetical protein